MSRYAPPMRYMRDEPRHRTKLCSGCKFNRFHQRNGRTESASRLLWMRRAKFRLHARSVRVPRYWRTT